MNSDNLLVICPKCLQQTFQSINNDNSIAELTCPQCDLKFISRLVHVRSKNKKRDKGTSLWKYSTRIIDPDTKEEELLEFYARGTLDDIELRSKDLALFTYHNNALCIIQNYTISTHYFINAVSEWKDGIIGSGIMIAGLIIVAIIVVILAKFGVIY